MAHSCGGILRQARKGRRADPAAVTRILETLPVLSACNDLRALTDLEAAKQIVKAFTDQIKPEDVVEKMQHATTKSLINEMWRFAPSFGRPFFEPLATVGR